ncbi:hypothetical protein BLNAU_20812 [Blattamonas nauphoetae]|uniref:Uncharacterized protein n=1 Tax=Blattamonas nauphoetae TaxID=2049346 RepID=A0ABQ9WZX1_9EUKA|nr:hypothetical protein BLNAU_20812 [Blattamonas nauphoetae]
MSALSEESHPTLNPTRGISDSVSPTKLLGNISKACPLPTAQERNVRIGFDVYGTNTRKTNQDRNLCAPTRLKSNRDWSHHFSQSVATTDSLTDIPIPYQNSHTSDEILRSIGRMELEEKRDEQASE